MKNKNFTNVVMVALIAVIFSMFTGCSSTQTGGGGAPIVQTATDLARKLGGASKAKAESNIVTLTGDVWVEKSLLVPAGVTLDLTRDGARLFLKDDVILTVNGTVNARGHGDPGNGWVDGGLFIDDGTIVINGNGTINLKSKGNLLNIWGGNGKRHLTLDGVTLVGLADNDNSLVQVSEGSELVLKSGVITYNTHTDAGGGVNVYKATFIMEGGTISGNASINDHGGGVSLWDNCTMIMSGGRISSNAAKGGGGVRVGENSMFTMTGGEISGNASTNDFGGGVSLYNNSTFTMEGGTISSNSASRNGGGVYLTGSSIFTMKGGTISSNSANRAGGGVDVRYGAIFILEGGTIYGSEADSGNANISSTGAALVNGWDDPMPIPPTAKWGTGGTYTKGDVPQTGGSDIVQAKRGQDYINETLIAIPRQ